MEGLLEHARHERRLAHGDGPFRHGFRDRLDIDGLEVLLVHPRAGRLTSHAQDRDRVGRGRVQAGDHVGPGRAGGADADADVTRAGPGVALGHVRRALDVPRQHMANRPSRSQAGVKRIDRRAGNAEGAGDAFPLHHQNGGVGGGHSGHGRLLPRIGEEELPSMHIGENGTELHMTYSAPEWRAWISSHCATIRP